ncbi:response regulator transcription factor [Streptomyces sp. M2CJ-2]|uniref:response regulator n=1 Tax=Streptomyces sp. M2CJ-2 TaxID=2803948 RepID=UPI0019293F81|nr:response regulator transcription factor [Streptomyces sp. M2CJ-2]MBL3667221.1 response regulator transcription factor [Streptomyces sp. M2CJ-2]
MPIRLLVVDDHQLVRDTLATVLGASTLVDVVGVACDGAEAVAAVLRLAPDVVLMDLAMPVMNGAEATRRLLVLRPGTRVVVLTSAVGGRLERAALDAGACTVLHKGTGIDVVLDAIVAVAPRD